MKQIAVALLIVCISAVFIQPVIEFANVLKEKVVLNTAMCNSYRAAEKNELKYENLRDLDAEINDDDFVKGFSEAFCETLNLSEVSLTEGRVVFSSNDGRFGEIIVNISVDSDLAGEREFALARIDIQTPYIFRSGLLKFINNQSDSVYKLIDGESYPIRIIN